LADSPVSNGNYCCYSFGLALLGSAAYGQATANIVGTLVTPRARPLPTQGSTFAKVETGLVRTTVSNSTGSYAAHGLSKGVYGLRVEAAYDQGGITGRSMRG